MGGGGGELRSRCSSPFFLWGSVCSQGRVAPKSAAYSLAKPAVMIGAGDSDDLVTASVREPQREEPSETGNLSALPSHELLTRRLLELREQMRWSPWLLVQTAAQPSSHLPCPSNSAGKS